MNYRLLLAIIFWPLALLTAIVLLLNPPDGVLFSQESGSLILFAFLTAFALIFGAALSQGELSAAHAVGLLAALALPPEARPTTTWAIALGGLAGGLLLIFSGDRRLPWQRPQDRSLRALVLIVVRVTLSFFFSHVIYTLLGGSLPLRLDGISQLLSAFGFSIVYTLIYFGLFLLESYGLGYGLRRTMYLNLYEILTVLWLPPLFAILGAHIYVTSSPLAFAICMIGLGLAIVAPYVISRTQQRLRKQVEELRSLSVMSQAIRANYQYGSLMHMVYVQVSNLLDIENFTVVLYNPSTQQLEYPLAIRNGQEIEVPPSPLPANSPVNRVLETQLPLLLARDAQKEGWVRGLSVPDDAYSWLGVPLQAGGSLFGAMVVFSPNERRVFNADDLRLLNIVAASASVALENSLLYERQTARAQRLALLNTILAQLTETLSLDDVLDRIMTRARELAGADAGLVLLAFGPGDGLRLARSVGLSDAFAGQNSLGLMLTPERGVPLGSLTPVLVGDVREDTRAASLRSRFLAEQIHAWIELPLVVGGGRVGMLVLYYRQPQRFADEDVEVLRVFATQAAQAIKNAHEYRRADEALSRRVGQLLALATISHELTATLDMRTICSLVLEFALNATFTHIGTIMLLDEYGDLDIMAQYGYPLESVSRHALLRQYVTNQAFKTGEPILIPDLSARPDLKPIGPGLRTQLAVPIVRRGEQLGVITLESDKSGAFSEEDVQFVQQLADQAIIAIDNTQLFQRIKEARDQLQLILDAMSEPLLLIDQTGTIALANPRVDKLGLHSEALLGQTVETLLAQPDLPLAARLGFESADALRALVRSLGARARQQHYKAYAYRLDHDTSPIYLERHIIPVHDDAGSTIGLLMVFYDETEARELMAAREDLTRMLVHDLRSPLTAVTTSLKLINDIIPAESEHKGIIESTSSTGRRAIKKLLNRVDSLLDVAKMESGQMTLKLRPVELATLIDSVCVELSPLAHEMGVTIDTSIPEDLPLLDIDADKVERVLLNLLDNALKFSPEDGRVIMRAHAPGTAEAPPAFVRVDMVDFGPGVPEEYRQTLFNRFVQVRGREGRRRGTGLGLTFCRLVVEAHQGRIWIEDNPEGGTIFSFTLPIAVQHNNGQL